VAFRYDADQSSGNLPPPDEHPKDVLNPVVELPRTTAIVFATVSIISSGLLTLSVLFSKSVLDRDLVADESQQVTTGCSHFLAARVRRDKIPFKGPNVAGYSHFKIFEFPGRKAVEESLNTTTDIVPTSIALAKCVGSDRRMSSVK
jgi:hypothetical protein